MDDIFIQSNASTNPVAITLNRTTKFSKLILVEYSIDGIPVTAGVPNSLLYNLDIENIGVNINFVTRNENIKGHPLRLTGVFTTESYASNPKVIATFPTPIHFNNFHIRIKDHTGADATFTKFALWLKAC